MAAMLKTSGYFSTSESARREVGMVQQVGQEITLLNLLISEDNSFLTYLLHQNNYMEGSGSATIK